MTVRKNAQFDNFFTQTNKTADSETFVDSFSKTANGSNFVQMFGAWVSPPATGEYEFSAKLETKKPKRFNSFVSVQLTTNPDLPLDHMERYQQLVSAQWLKSLISGNNPHHYDNYV